MANASDPISAALQVISQLGTARLKGTAKYAVKFGSGKGAPGMSGVLKASSPNDVPADATEEGLLEAMAGADEATFRSNLGRAGHNYTDAGYVIAAALGSQAGFDRAREVEEERAKVKAEREREKPAKGNRGRKGKVQEEAEVNGQVEPATVS